MFAEGKGTFLPAGLATFVTLLIGSAIYNVALRADARRVTGAAGMEMGTFVRAAFCLSVAMRLTAALQITDSVLQDRHRHPSWGDCYKREWNESGGGFVRVMTVLVIAGIAVVVTTCIVLEDEDSSVCWVGGLNDTWRSLLAGLLTVCDLLAVLQDWEFPTFDRPDDVGVPVMIAGTRASSLSTGFMVRLLEHPRVPRRLREFVDVSVGLPWLTYGPLFCVVLLDLLSVRARLFYRPDRFGQYVHPDTRRIWTIVDEDYLDAAYDAGILRNLELVTWAARWNATSGAPLNPSAATDIELDALYVGSWVKDLVFAICLLTLLAFAVLVHRGERALHPHFARNTKKVRAAAWSNAPRSNAPPRLLNGSVVQKKQQPTANRKAVPPRHRQPGWGSQPRLVKPNSLEKCRAVAALSSPGCPEDERKSERAPPDSPWCPGGENGRITAPPVVLVIPPGAPQEAPEGEDYNAPSWTRCKPPLELEGQGNSHEECGVMVEPSDAETRESISHAQLSLSTGVLDKDPEGCPSDLALSESEITPRPPEGCSPSSVMHWPVAGFAGATSHHGDTPEHFDVLFRRNGQPLGLCFRKPTTPSICELLVVEVASEGAVAAHNMAEAAAGKWDSIVLPGMVVHGVNGIRDNLDRMLQELSTAEMLTVRFWRVGAIMSTPLPSDTERLLSERVARLVKQAKLQMLESLMTNGDWEAATGDLVAAVTQDVCQANVLLRSLVLPLPPQRPPGMMTPPTKLPALPAPIVQLGRPAAPAMPPRMLAIDPSTELEADEACSTVSEESV